MHLLAQSHANMGSYIRAIIWLELVSSRHFLITHCSSGNQNVYYCYRGAKQFKGGASKLK